MAGEWIKMRTNLWNDPRISQICDITNQSEAAVIGAMYWLWATADEHTQDGFLPGLSCAGIDRKTGVQGFANALVTIGWLSANADGVTLERFEEHNGASAKSRAQTAKRVANHKSNAQVTQDHEIANAPTVTSALPREEKNKNKNKDSAGAPQLPGLNFDVKAELSARGVDGRVADDWIKHRKAKRASVTETVLLEHIAEANKAALPLAKALAYACNAGWQAFRADWYFNRENRTQTPQPDSSFVPRRDRVI